MAAYPPHPRLPASNYCGGVLPSHLIAVATSLRAGDRLRERYASHLQLLLCSYSSSMEDVCHLVQKKDFWCLRSYSFKCSSLLQKFSESFSASCASCFDFFSGKDFGGGYVNEGKMQIKSTGGRPVDGRMWTNVLPINVCFDFFSAKDFGGGYVNEEKMQIKSTGGRPVDGRMWTNVLLAINVLVYAAQLATEGKLLLWGAKVNSLINKGELWRLATSSLLHANIGHLMINCYSLNSIGPTVEHLSGPRRFLAVYIASAISSSVMSYYFSQSPAVGASGAIFGLVGSYAVFVLRHRNLVGGGHKELQHIAHVITLNMVIGAFSSGIDNWGHLGGLLGGVAVSWFLGPAWQFMSRANDGRLVVADRAPIFHFINRRRLP